MRIAPKPMRIAPKPMRIPPMALWFDGIGRTIRNLLCGLRWNGLLGGFKGVAAQFYSCVFRQFYMRESAAMQQPYYRSLSSSAFAES